MLDLPFLHHAKILNNDSLAFTSGLCAELYDKYIDAHNNYVKEFNKCDLIKGNMIQDVSKETIYYRDLCDSIEKEIYEKYISLLREDVSLLRKEMTRGLERITNKDILSAVSFLASFNDTYNAESYYNKRVYKKGQKAFNELTFEERNDVSKKATIDFLLKAKPTKGDIASLIDNELWEILDALKVEQQSLEYDASKFALILSEYTEQRNTKAKELLDGFRTWQRERKESKNDVLSVNAVAPENAIIPLDKVSDVVFSPACYGIDTEDLKKGASVYVGGEKKKIYTSVAIDYDGIATDTGLTLTKKLTAFDQAVYNAILTLKEAGNVLMTPTMIFKAMNGIPAKEQVSVYAEKQKEILASIHKMATTMMHLDAEREAVAFGYEDNFVKQFDTTILKMTSIKAKINGQEVNAIRIEETALFDKYVKIKKQLATIPLPLLAPPINKTNENRCIELYLLTRIERAKHPRNKAKTKKTILYGKLYERVAKEKAKEALDRTEKQRIRSTAKKLLNYYIARKYIKGYKEKAKGNEAYSLTFEL